MPRVWRLTVLCVVLGGCGFESRLVDAALPPVDGLDIDVPEIPDAEVDAMIDAPIDAPAPVSCLERWRDGTITFLAPVEQMALSTSGAERDPWLSGDRLRI